MSAYSSRVVVISPDASRVGSNSERVAVALLGGGAAGTCAGSSEGDGTWTLFDSVRRAGSIGKSEVGSLSELSRLAIAWEIGFKNKKIK